MHLAQTWKKTLQTSPLSQFLRLIYKNSIFEDTALAKTIWVKLT